MRIHQVSASLAVCSVMFALLLSLSGCERTSRSAISNGDPVPGATDVVNLEQGWSRETQDRAWFTSFGSRLMPYEWFLSLEQANNNELFRSDAHLAEFGFLTQHATANNPDGLPVGFSRDVDQRQQPWIGLTCAACHTGEVHFRGTKIRIDGGQSLLDFTAFDDAVIAAMIATAADSAKFERFADRVLTGARSDRAARDALSAALGARAQQLQSRNRMNATDVPYGYGRLDAFGQIFNAASVVFLDQPDNRRTPDAPVSYPVLWSAAHLDVVQWNGSAPNFGPGPLVQNATTALAVYGDVHMTRQDGLRGYASSVDVENLALIQNWVYDLKSPQWPQRILGDISAPRAARGHQLYTDNCQSCHALSDRDDPTRKLKTTLVPLDDIGTDRRAAENFVTSDSATGFLQGQKVAYMAGEHMGERTATINIVVHAALGALLRHPLESMRAALTDYHSVYKASVDAQPLHYKARPLDGIWSSAPYLHNGSVPTLHDLLLPPEQRPATFYVGGRDFDAQRVGLDTSQGDARNLFDTRAIGNGNGGHTYGTRLSLDQKKDLIEFLKTL